MKSIGAALLMILAACAVSPDLERSAIFPPTAAPSLYIGDVVEPSVQLQDFALPSSTGETMRLSDLNGKWRVMFFGYLHCPDFCPLTLVEYREVKQHLDDAAAQVVFVYISVDGARDTPQAIHDYLDNFDAEFIGFSADDATLERIQPDYGFYYRRQLDQGSQAVYTIDHSTRSYLVDPQGYLRATFTYDTEPAMIAQAIQWYLQAQDGASAS